MELFHLSNRVDISEKTESIPSQAEVCNQLIYIYIYLYAFIYIYIYRYRYIYIDIYCLHTVGADARFDEVVYSDGRFSVQQ